MIYSTSESTIDFGKMESIPECNDKFPVVCYEYDLYFRTEPWHWHDEFEATIIEEGEAILKLEGEEYTLRKGEGYLINSEVLHSLMSNNRTHCKICSMVFRKNFIGGVPESIFWEKYIFPVTEKRDFYGWVLKSSIEWQNEILQMIEKVFELFKNETEDYEIETREILSRLLSVTIKRLPSSNNNKNNTKQNVKSVLFMTKHTIPYMRKNGKGSIVNTSSLSGIVGDTELTPYHATKGTIVIMTQKDAIQYAPEHIRVNCVCPGTVMTPLVQGLLKDDPHDLDNDIKRYPIGYFGEPNDVAYGVLFLASDEGRFVTGTKLVIDGGYSAQ